MAKVKLESDDTQTNKLLAEAERKLPNVGAGTVKMKEKPASRKFKEAIFSSETKDVKSYLMFGIIIPAIKNTIVNVGKSALELVFGVDGTATYSSSSKRKLNTPYYQYYSSEMDTYQKQSTKLTNSYSRYAYRELNCVNFAFATDVRDRLVEALSKYHRVSVGDLYDTVQEVCQLYQIETTINSETTDYKWGWKNLEKMHIKREIDGSYTLILPDPMYLD